MSLRAKITMIAINLVGLVVTLAYPNSATPIAVLPVIVSVSTWLITFDEQKQPITKYIGYLLSIVLLGALCILLSFLCDIEATKGAFQFVFKSMSIFETLPSFSYWPFAVLVFIDIAVMSVLELFKSHANTKINGSFTQQNNVTVAYIDYQVNIVIW